MPTLPGDVCSRYRALTLYNSPYAAHDRGCAVDFYPDEDDGVPSPVAGEVVDTRRVRAPPKPYAEADDHLVVLDTGEHLVRILHVDPTVEPGERVSVGDDLGRLVRAGFFAPWVDNHLHVGFRDRDANPYRASGSLPLAVDVDPEPLDWDGTGRVVETGETYAVLDAPANPRPGEWVGVAADGGGVLDGGLVHYDGGGLHGGAPGPVELLGQRVGIASERRVDGRTDAVGATHDCTWDSVAVYANGERVTGLSLFLSRERFGAKVICPDHSFAQGERVAVSLESTDDPTVLG